MAAHTKIDLYQMQSLPLDAKIRMTARRIDAFIDRNDAYLSIIAAICIPWKNSGGHTSQKVCGQSTGFQLLFNAKSSPHGKTKRQNRRAAHMERQRAPPKGREAENGSRGIDSRGRIPERLCRCHSRYAKEKRAEAAAGAGKESPTLVFH